MKGGSSDSHISIMQGLWTSGGAGGWTWAKWHVGRCVYVWAVSEGCSKKPTLNSYLSTCRDASVYDCGCRAFLFPCLHSKILLEDMITRCQTRVLPINKNRPRMHGQSVGEWRHVWQKPTVDCTGRQITHHFVTNLASNSLGGDVHTFRKEVNDTMLFFFALCLFSWCAHSHSDEHKEFLWLIFLIASV